MSKHHIHFPTHQDGMGDFGIFVNQHLGNGLGHGRTGSLFAAEDASADMLKAGVKANEVYEAMYRVVREAGYKDFDMGGHGTGIDSHEPPSIDAWNEQMIEEMQAEVDRRWQRLLELCGEA